MVVLLIKNKFYVLVKQKSLMTLERNVQSMEMLLVWRFQDLLEERNRRAVERYYIFSFVQWKLTVLLVTFLLGLNIVRSFMHHRKLEKIKQIRKNFTLFYFVSNFQNMRKCYTLLKWLGEKKCI